MDRDKVLIAGMSVYSDWTILSDATENLAQSTTFLLGATLDFDKVNGSGAKYGGVYRDDVTIGHLLSQASICDRVVWPLYVSSTADIDYAFVWLGTSSTNYMELRFDDDSITAGAVNLCACPLLPAYIGGVGAKLESVTWIATGVMFDGEDDALAEIYVGDIYLEKTVNVKTS